MIRGAVGLQWRAGRAWYASERTEALNEQESEDMMRAAMAIKEYEPFFKDECYAIQGAAFEVYRTLGCGFLESVYQESLELEMASRNIPFVAQQELLLDYKGKTLKHTYKPDFICYGSIIVELKACSGLAPENEAQLLNYMKATDLHLGLLLNFGHCPGVEVKRMRR